MTADAPAQPGELLAARHWLRPTDRLRPEGFPVPLAPAYAMADRVVLLGDLTVGRRRRLRIARPDRHRRHAFPGVPAGLPSGANAPLRVRI